MQSCRTLDWLSLKNLEENVLLPRFQKHTRLQYTGTQFWLLPVTCVIE